VRRVLYILALVFLVMTLLTIRDSVSGLPPAIQGRTALTPSQLNSIRGLDPCGEIPYWDPEAEPQYCDYEDFSCSGCGIGCPSHDIEWSGVVGDPTPAGFDPSDEAYSWSEYYWCSWHTECDMTDWEDGLTCLDGTCDVGPFYVGCGNCETYGEGYASSVAYIYLWDWCL